MGTTGQTGKRAVGQSGTAADSGTAGRSGYWERVRSWSSLAVSLVLVLGFSGYKLGMIGSVDDANPWNGVSSYPDRIVLTWSGDPATTQSITWRTDTTVANPVVQYALASPGPGFGFEAQ